jgi:NAD(P)H-dependent flavin oxidoreductase YrpB (nitropropane dioxygenase family)
MAVPPILQKLRIPVIGAPMFIAVNQIVHKSNDRLEHDLEVCIRHKVPITITSLRAPNDVVAKIHA